MKKLLQGSPEAIREETLESWKKEEKLDDFKGYKQSKNRFLAEFEINPEP